MFLAKIDPELLSELDGLDPQRHRLLRDRRRPRRLRDDDLGRTIRAGE
jgi:hypothetical protein